MLLPDHIGKTFYDSLGSDQFRDMCIELIKSEFGRRHVYPGPKKGKDEGIDCLISKSGEPDFIQQSKWHEVINYGYGNKKLRNLVIKELECELKKFYKKGKNIRYLFITNVAFTPEYLQKIKEIIEKSRPLIDAEVWSFESLNSLLRSKEDILIQYFPHLGLDIKKIKNELITKRITEKSKRRGNINFDKFKKVFEDFELKKRYYYAFIYLLSPWYLNDRSKKEREKIYRLFEIKKEDEDKIIEKLKIEKYIRIESEMGIVNDKNKAEDALSEVIDKMDTSLENLVKLFL